MYPKLDFLKTECVDRKPDIVCLTETWLDNGITNDELSIPDFNLIRLDRNRHGGGVALYINVNFAFKVIYLGDDSFECVIVCIQEFITIRVCNSHMVSTPAIWILMV